MTTPATALQRLFTQLAIPLTLLLTLGGCNADSANSKRDSAQATATPSVDTAAKSSAHSAPTRTGYADVEGGRIYYQVYGDLNSRKTPLLVLHGSFMSGDAMAPFIDAFAASRPVIAIDARGHGKTGDLPGPITHELMADDAVAVLTALGVPSADVLGYSMGGTTAIFLAVRHPDRTAKQIIVSGTSRIDGWYPEVVQAMKKITPAAFAGSPIEAEYKRLSPTPDKFSAFVEEVIGLEKMNYASTNEAVRAIKGKTMIIAGDADGVLLEHAVELFKLRGGGDRETAMRGYLPGPPRARLSILPAASHIGMMAEAERIAALAVPFLDDRSPPRATGFFKGMDTPPDSTRSNK